jgi:hypothetical protein
MQADVVGSTAGLCAAKLYEELAEGTALDQALARAQIFVSQNLSDGTETREPFMAALTVTLPPEEILTVRSSKRETVKAVDQCRMLSNVIKVFVDRAEQRSKLIDSFYPVDPQTDPYSLVLVEGDSQAGKSWIARWCMDACARHRHQVQYVEVVRACSDWLAVLRAIRDGDGTKTGSLVHGRLDPARFHIFNWELNQRLLHNVVNPDRPEVATPTDDAMASLGETPSEHVIASTFASFREALQVVAEQTPLLLVLDHFSSEREALPAAHFRYLWEHLIARVGAGEVKNVKVVVVLSKTEKERDYEILSELERNYAEIPIAGLPPEQFFELGRELFSLLYSAQQDAQPLIEQYFQLHQRKIIKDWKISTLTGACQKLRELLAQIPGALCDQ